MKIDQLIKIITAGLMGLLIAGSTIAFASGGVSGGGVHSQENPLFAIYLDDVQICSQEPVGENGCSSQQDHFNPGQRFYVWFKVKECVHNCQTDISMIGYVNNQQVNIWNYKDSGCYTWYWFYWWFEVYSTGWNQIKVSVKDNIDGSTTNVFADIYINPPPTTTTITVTTTTTTTTICQPNIKPGECIYDGSMGTYYCPDCVLPKGQSNVIWKDADEDLSATPNKLTELGNKLNHVLFYDGCKYYTWANAPVISLGKLKQGYCYAFITNSEIEWTTCNEGDRKCEGEGIRGGRIYDCAVGEWILHDNEYYTCSEVVCLRDMDCPLNYKCDTSEGSFDECYYIGPTTPPKCEKFLLFCWWDDFMKILESMFGGW